MSNFENSELTVSYNLNDIRKNLKKIEKLNDYRFLIEFQGESFIIDRRDPYSDVGKEVFKLIDKGEIEFSDFIEDELARFPQLKAFIQNKITTQDFLLHIQEVSLNFFKSEWQKTDELIAMREKRKLLDIWHEDDEINFIDSMNDYKSLVEEYKTIKNECINLSDNKEMLVNYYQSTVISRLNELKHD